MRSIWDLKVQSKEHFENKTMKQSTNEASRNASTLGYEINVPGRLLIFGEIIKILTF